MTKKDFKYGFSLTELLVSITIMAVLSLLVVFAVVKKTQKTLSVPKSGKLICYKDMDGRLHLRSELKKHKNASVEYNDELVNQCTMNIPATATNAVVYIIGAGGGGAGNQTSEPSTETETNIKINMKSPESLNSLTKVTDFNSGNASVYYTYTLEPNDSLICEVETCAQGTKSGYTHIGANGLQANDIIQCAPNGTSDYTPRLSAFISSTLNGSIQKYTALNENVCGNDKKITYHDAMLNLSGYFDDSAINDCAKNVFKSGTKYHTMFGSNSYVDNHPSVIYPNYIRILTKELRATNTAGCTSHRENIFLLTVYMASDNAYCYCGKTGTIACSNTLTGDDKAFLTKLMGGNLITANLDAIKKIKGISIGNPGANGEVIKKTIGSAYAGKNIVIQKESIGTGGEIGVKGGDTELKDSFGAVNEKAKGGNPGTISSKTRNRPSPFNDYEKLSSDFKLKRNSIFSMENDFIDNRGDGGLSEYYRENPSGVLDPNELILPNASCTVNPDGKPSITQYDKKNDNLYNKNYGGGGGGYIPCVANFGYITRAVLSHMDNSNPGNYIDTQYKGSAGAPTLQHGTSTKGMGGAIIIQWGQ